MKTRVSFKRKAQLNACLDELDLNFRYVVSVDVGPSQREACITHQKDLKSEVYSMIIAHGGKIVVKT